ncbi:hypothetical protein P7C70_g7979, partial [Phenoliferia sp. Uapishka_3]
MQMPTTLLDLPDEILAMICEATRNRSNPAMQDQDELFDLAQVNQRLRSIAQVSLWAHISLGRESQTAPDAYIVKLLSLNPRLWSYIKYIEMDVDEGFEWSLFIATAFNMARNLRGVYLVNAEDFDFRIPIVMTNALRSSDHLQNLTICCSNIFEDPSFNFCNLQHLETIGVCGGDLTHLLIENGGPPGLKRVIARMIDGVVSGKFLGWALSGVENAHIEAATWHDEGKLLWTHDLLEELNQLADTRELQLTSLSFNGVEGFFNLVADNINPSSAAIFSFFARTTLTSISFDQFGEFHWTEELSRMKLPAVTKLSIGYPKSQRTWERVAKYLCLHLFPFLIDCNAPTASSARESAAFFGVIPQSQGPRLARLWRAFFTLPTC